MRSNRGRRKQRLGRAEALARNTGPRQSGGGDANAKRGERGGGHGGHVWNAGILREVNTRACGGNARGGVVV